MKQIYEWGHILSRIYNSTKPGNRQIRAYFKESLQLHWNEKFLTSSFKIFYHLLKISDDFFSHSPRISSNLQSFQPFKMLQVQLHRQFLLTFFHHSVNIFSTFFGFHPSFPLLHFQIYNYNCTIPILQLQITFYNCRNCHQLHVKICPDIYSLHTIQRLNFKNARTRLDIAHSTELMSDPTAKNISLYIKIYD